MDVPVNAVYGKNDKPVPADRPLEIWGMRIPASQRWIVFGGILGAGAVFVFVTLVLLPSGIPYLAAKNSSGFLEYVGLFFLYMLGFSLLVIGVIFGVALLGHAMQRDSFVKDK